MKTNYPRQFNVVDIYKLEHQSTNPCIKTIYVETTYIKVPTNLIVNYQWPMAVITGRQT